MLTHGHDFGDDRFASPFDAEYLGQLLEVLSGRFSYREYRVSQPAHAERAELLIEEFHAQLACKKGNIFDDGQPDSPLLVLG